MIQNSVVSLKASRKTLSRIPQGGLVHMKQLWRSQSQCRHLQEHASGVMSQGDIAPPVPSRQRRGKATASTHSDWSKKRLKNKNKNKNKLTTNQWLVSQNNRLATHQCPQDSTTNNSTLSNRYREQTKTGGHPRHLCAVYAVEIYETNQDWDTQAQPTSTVTATP